MMLTVVIPSYKRPQELANCLAGIDAQERQPDEVIVVCREEDAGTLAFVKQWEAAPAAYLKRHVQVSRPGVIHAMQTGVENASGDIVAFIDDDAVPWKDWAGRLLEYYRDPRVGGVGGRDVIAGRDHTIKKPVVGRVTWYGKLIGNHDQGYGSPREVDVLKGVNMSFRTPLVKFPGFMKGKGAQVHFEVFLCMGIRRLGYKLIYDPELRVDHYPAARHDIDQRNAIVRDAVANASFNLSVALLHGLPAYRRPARIAYGMLVGDRRMPGVVRMLYGAARRDKTVVQTFLPSMKGQLEGVLYYFRHADAPAPGPGQQQLQLKEGQRT
ncbi:glycosyltransferase [Paenibacillus sp. YN15]|uniref:glycosyltransferase family 2 protein n=1 Tax=Paenibacillus sp. YN15 TaxID=1742774 RepID=UPI000DCEADD1|nr:glycosyltransferase [Paenibacillus sp. YN15]RAU95109.1 glycosyltransferase family 2 protein [Paenibacillus sp. YN15]